MKKVIPIPHKRIKDLTNKKIGESGLVVGYVGINKHNESRWIIKCSCGELFEVSAKSISDSNPKPLQNCRPCTAKIRGEKMTKNINGKFSRWTVLYKSSQRNNSNIIMYVCKCECGTIRSVTGNALRCGDSKSCGCISAEFITYLANNQNGSNNPNWNPDITDKERQMSKDKRQGGNSREIVSWRKQVFERDNYICQCCGRRGNKLNAHHLNGWNKFIDQRYDLNNGFTLCIDCHKLFHKKFGSGDNIKSQYQDFIVQLYNG